jgi:CSLREA domain-containing protein
MKTGLTRLSTAVALLLCARFVATISAATFTVNSTDDPAIVDPSNCKLPGLSCSLREALAAADETTQADSVVFAVDGPIHLTRRLTAVEAVTIDGGGTTTVRVHQGYTIAMLQDRPAFGNDVVEVLQPTYYSVNAANRPILELHGSGSRVENLTIDGSITPDPADLGVERIDYDSDGETDFLLLTLDTEGGPRWPIAGGARFELPLGSCTISGNQLQNFNGNAITVEGTGTTTPVIAPTIVGNVVTGGAAGQPYASAEGIVLYYAAFAQVSDNTVEDYRRGCSALFVSGLTVSGNQFSKNGTGFEVAYGDTSAALNVIDGNSITKNAQHGIKISYLSGGQISNNELNKNGSDPDYHGGVLVEDSSTIAIESNELNKNSGFGVTLSGTELCSVGSNEANFNGGAGIVLFNQAHGNQIEYNHAQKNSVGLVAGIFGAFPYGNTIVGNTFTKNLDVDILDQDPACNESWSGNRFDTADGDCIE